MEQLVLLTRWADYSGGQLAVAEVDESYAEALVDKLKAIGLVNTYEVVDDEERGPRGGAKKKPGGLMRQRAVITIDQDYQDAQQAKLETYARRKLLQARHAAFERDAAVVSRELSRRIERDPSARRTARMGGGR